VKSKQTCTDCIHHTAKKGGRYECSAPVPAWVYEHSNDGKAYLCKDCTLSDICKLFQLAEKIPSKKVSSKKPEDTKHQKVYIRKERHLHSEPFGNIYYYYVWAFYRAYDHHQNIPVVLMETLPCKHWTSHEGYKTARWAKARFEKDHTNGFWYFGPADIKSSWIEMKPHECITVYEWEELPSCNVDN